MGFPYVLSLFQQGNKLLAKNIAHYMNSVAQEMILRDLGKYTHVNEMKKFVYVNHMKKFTCEPNEKNANVNHMKKFTSKAEKKN